MFGRRKQTSTRIDTLLGKAATLNGDLEFSGGLHLDGRINGNVRSCRGRWRRAVGQRKRLHRGQRRSHQHRHERHRQRRHASRASAWCSAASARVNGNVHYGVIEMAPGAVITGKLDAARQGAQATPSAETPAEAASAVAAAKSGA